MGAIRVLVLLLSLWVLVGCTFLQAGKLLAPERFGLVQVTPRIYVEAGADLETHHWQFLVASGIARPSADELRTFRSLKQWIDAVHKYGDGTNIERKAMGQPEIRPLYAAAGHEVRPWLAKAGTRGLLALIARLNAGEEFDSAYQAANRE